MNSDALFPASADITQPAQVWYVLEKDETLGPFTQSEIEARIQTGAIDANTLLWRDGQEDWLPAAQTEAGHFLHDRLPVQAAPLPDDTLTPAAASTQTITSPITLSSAAIVGAISALIGVFIEVATPFQGTLYGCAFGLMVGMVFYKAKIFGAGSWITFIVTNTIGYVAARAIVFQMIQNSRQPVGDAFFAGAFGSLVGAGLVWAGLAFTGHRWARSLVGSMLILIVPTLIGGIVMLLSISAEMPKMSDWPTNKILLIVIHLPWQIAFAVGIIASLKISSIPEPAAT